MKYLVIGALVATAIGGLYLAATMTSGSTEVQACMPGQTVDGNGVCVRDENVAVAATPQMQPIATSPLSALSRSVVSPRPYQELVTPSAYLHTNGEAIKIADYVGKRIIMLTFMTYSCSNCQQTFPHTVALDEQYRDDGLLVIGIHTPEFAYEHDATRVATALAKYGITFPVVLDNEYTTWRAYNNRYWPRRYIIDATGSIVYDHIGEGDYEGAEEVIKALLPTLPAV